MSRRMCLASVRNGLSAVGLFSFSLASNCNSSRLFYLLPYFPLPLPSRHEKSLVEIGRKSVRKQMVEKIVSPLKVAITFSSGSLILLQFVLLYQTERERENSAITTLAAFVCVSFYVWEKLAAVLVFPKNLHCYFCGCSQFLAVKRRTLAAQMETIAKRLTMNTIDRWNWLIFLSFSIPIQLLLLLLVSVKTVSSLLAAYELNASQFGRVNF